MSLSGVLTPFVVPPVNLAVLTFLALCCRRRVLAMTLLAALLALGTPIVADALTYSLEIGLPDSVDPVGAQAILVLGGDVDRDRDGRPMPGPLTLERLRGGAALARASGLPLAVTGGPAWSGGPAIGSIMADSMARDFGLAPRWVETRSATTWENARDSAALLNPEGVHIVLVVTNAWHMRRSLLAFRHSGLVARPAPLWLDMKPRLRLDGLVPRASAWQASYYALHEWIGIAWYGLRDWRAG